MKTRRIEVKRPIIEDKTANQINFSFSRKVGGLFTTETDLEFAKICVRLANVQKIFFQKIVLKVITAIRWPLKTPDRLA